MDFTPVVAQVWGMLIWFIPAALLLCLLKSPWPKGHIGELLVELIAHWQLDKQTYRRLHNVTQNTPESIKQIDHVFLSLYGIFVLETKNTNGWIFGSGKERQWTQKLYKRMFKFQNPLRQSYKPLKAMEASLEVNPEHPPSVITFRESSTFKTEVRDIVTQGNGFIRYIQSFQQPLFGVAEVDAVLYTPQTGRFETTLTTNREHVQNLKRRSDPIAEWQCPKFVSALLIRTVKYGAKVGQEFGGYSTFPICRTKLRI